MKFKSLSFATMIIFGTGVVVGGLWVNHLRYAKPQPSHRHPPVSENRPADLRPPKILSQPFLQRLDVNLNLTPLQYEAIQKIMSESQNQVRKAVQNSRLEIREVLTPSQRIEFDSLVKRHFRKPIFATNKQPAFPSASQ